MIMAGSCLLKEVNGSARLMQVVNKFTITNGAYSVTIKEGAVTDGATIPWPFTFWFDPFDEDYIIASVVHDCLIGQFGAPYLVVGIEGGTKQLTWKEAAVWCRELMKLNKGNHKIIRRLFYHSIMLKKRLGIRI